ncbi:MAG: carboxypeptidase-like regulatory domain-containing protein [Candidatus Woesearchaeota archaeon]|nr:carboxypeptidase-like regulatory domain-containing protein [Candidatus Woesearchaeota archaeon]
MNAKINAKLTILLGLSLLLMPFANALTVNDFFQNFYGLVENQYAFYTIMFLVTFIFLFSVFFALSKYIPFFKGSGGNVGPAGQIFALSLSAIATLSIFAYVQRNGGASYASGFFTNRVGSWGWILLALLILAVVFFALKKGKGFGFGGGEGGEGGNLKGLTALLWVLSFILVMYGSISKNRTITTIGAVLFVIALILTVLTGGFKFGENGEPKPPHPPPVPPEPPEGYGTIYGVVSDKATKHEIPHARIECAGYAVLADPKGNYAITVPIGQYVLAAAKQGYNDYRSNPIQVTGKARIEHNIEMESSSAEKGTIEGMVVILSEFQQGHEVGLDGATVKLYMLGQDNQPRILNIRPQVSENGKFSFKDLSLPMTNILVYAEKGGKWNTHMGGSWQNQVRGRPDHLINLDDRTKEEKNVLVVLDVPLPPTQTSKIKGKIVDVTDINNPMPLTNSRAAVLKEGDRNLPPMQPTRNGEFEFNVPFGTYIVFGEADDYESVEGLPRGKHTDRGGHPSIPIKIDENTPPVEGVIVPLKKRGTPPPRPTELPNIKVELDSQTLQKLTAGDKYDHLIFKTKNYGGKARVRLFVNLYKNYENYVTDLDYRELRASRQVKEIDAGQWQLKIKRLVRGDFTEVREDNSKRLMELTMAKGTMVQIEFEIPKNAQGIYHIQLTAAALKPGNKEYYTEEFCHDTKWYIVEVIKKGIEKEIKESKKKTIAVKKEAERAIRSKTAEATVKWADKKMLKDLKDLIDNVDEKIKILQKINIKECERILKESRFKNNLEAIKTIYKAQSSGNEAQLRRYEQYTYEKVFKIAEIISDFLDERIDAWHKHTK